MVQMLRSERSDEEAAVIVMLPEPSKATVLMRRGVASLVVLVEVPTMVLMNVFVPEKVLLLASKVVDAPVNVVWLCQYAADVVLKKVLTDCQYVAEVVENELVTKPISLLKLERLS